MHVYLDWKHVCRYVGASSDLAPLGQGPNLLMSDSSLCWCTVLGSLGSLLRHVKLRGIHLSLKIKALNASYWALMLQRFFGWLHRIGKASAKCFSWPTSAFYDPQVPSAFHDPFFMTPIIEWYSVFPRCRDSMGHGIEGTQIITPWLIFAPWLFLSRRQKGYIVIIEFTPSRSL